MKKNQLATVFYPLTLLFFTPLIFRAIWTDIHIYSDTSTRLLGAVQVLAHDAPVFFFMSLVLYISFLPRIHRILAVVLRLTSMAGYSIYLLDLFLLTNFNTHLAISDIFKYASYAWTYMGQLYPYFLALIAGSGLFLVLALRLAWSGSTITKRPIHWLSGIVLALLMILPLLRSDHAYVHGWRYQNVVEYNLEVLGEARPYSRGFTERITAEPPTACTPHTPSRKNIIVLMVESLSAYQSRLFSGINDWTPHLDAIAENNRYFTRFLANGFTTEDGEIALLTGRLPIYGPASFTNWGGTRFRGFFQLPDALPQILKPRGYHCEYLTSADLAFAQTGEWARSIGFDHIEGHDHPSYDNWPRYQFKAAPDEALYARVLARVNQHPAGRSFFLFVKTAGTHHPFVEPETGKRSARAAFINADRQLGRFYQQLTKNGFFDEGLLIIVGDHRAMVPMGRQEIEGFGALEAAARVPLVVVDQDRHAGIEAPFQQTDVYNSLKNMVSTERCTSPWLGNLIGQLASPEYIGFRRGDRRDLVTVFTPQGPIQIRLAGDATRIIGDTPSAPTQMANIVNKINHIRIRGDINQRRFEPESRVKPQRRFSYH